MKLTQIKNRMTNASFLIWTACFAVSAVAIVLLKYAFAIGLYGAQIFLILLCTAAIAWIITRLAVPKKTAKDRLIDGQPGKNDKLSTGFYLFLAFFVPFFLMFLFLAMAGVSPFGSNQIMVVDLWHQYYPFLSSFQSKLQSGGSLLWTWSGGGGTNYLGLMAYYLASPLNLLSVLFPAELLREFLYVATCVKIGLAGLFFALFLRITFKRSDASLSAFGIMYALCAFIMGYYWNVIWLDTVALLPLVVAGTIALLKEGKFRLYVVSLALSIFANYYIGLFTCIFVVLVSIGYTIVEFKGWRKTLRDLLKTAGFSIVSVMMTAVLTLPAYLALKYTHSSNNSFPTGFSVNMGGTPDLGGILSGVGKTIASTLALIQPNTKDGTLPNVYCGVFTIFLAILFLFCTKIKKRERIYCAGLLFFFTISFISRRLDYIWHGFHFPNMLYFRFSFLFSFVLLYMAFRVFMNLDSLKPASVIGAIGGFGVYLGAAAIYYYGEGGPELSSLFTSAEGANSPSPVLMSGFFGLLMAAWVLLYAFRPRLSHLLQAILSAVIGVASGIFVILSADAILSPLRKNNASLDTTGLLAVLIIILLIATGAVFFALYSKKFNQNNRFLKTMLSVILLTLALVEGLMSAASGVNAVGTTSTQWYPLGTTNTPAHVETIKEREADHLDLYRTEVNKYYTLNDNVLIGVNGISMFSSMVNKSVTDYMEKFGICGWIASNRYTYQESSPFTNMMLNIKYLICHNSNYQDPEHMELIDTKGTVNLLQNKYYLPMGFLVKDSLLEYDVDALSSSEPLKNQNLFFNLATGIVGDLYTEIETTADSSSQIKAVAPHSGLAVCYVTSHDKSSRTLSINVNSKKIVDRTIQRAYIMMIGNVEEGDVLTCSSGTGRISGKFAMMDENLFRRAHDMFERSTLRATKVEDTYIRGNINAVEDGLFYTSIPAIAGWKAYVDSKEVGITPVGGAMIAFELSAGPHIIELEYSPEGYPGGLIVSILGLLIFIVMILLSRRRINLIDRYLAPHFAGRAGKLPSRKDHETE